MLFRSIGISSCLLGENVRYDGGNTKNDYITEELSRQFEFIPYCPEVAVGMGIPRPPIQLVAFNGEIRAQGIDNPAMDITLALHKYAKKIAQEIDDLSGYIFKKNSPSCGIKDVKVLVGTDKYELRGQGLFAAEIMRQLPDLPVINEQQLTDETLRHQFMDNVRTYYQTNQQ